MSRDKETDQLFPGVFNFRDLGGLPAGNHRVRSGRVYRSDSLAGLRETDRAAFADLGIRTVIDLRRASEVEQDGRIPDWPEIAYHNIDPGHREWGPAPWFESDELSPFLSDRYQDLVDETAARLVHILGFAAREDALPLVVHCWAGRDRTGVVCALLLALLGVSDTDIDADYARSSAANARYTTWARVNGENIYTMCPWYRAPVGTMRRFLTEFRHRHGSIERFLTTAGLTDATTAAIRTRLLSR
ncbi:protein tyrosine/serine phosphatase [Stackebrandtia endophytica]|uniref:Protein tyrosine/serine phosphatase n=1 Tax=Stackebrandtia endophytica TaxID=1496996 RepID=A0A543AZ98_9ACTN|nr:tyrosine-protein phosphatase [Stackebrandtia endophytica]TQL77902.1 protein tyrosine/serine phosphatase [Stackebrandtia endophytica]